MMTEPVGKKRNYIGEYFAKMTPEEKKQFYADTKRKREATIAKKNKAVIEARKKAEDMLPELIAQDLLMAENDSYVPRQDTLDRLRSLADSGLTMEELRRKYFKYMSDKGWQKLNKFLFKSHVSQIEDVGLNLLLAKKKHKVVLERRIAEIDKAIKAHKKKYQTKVPSVSLLAMRASAEDKLHEMEMDEAKVLHTIGAVGEKAKAASINVHLSIPRPPAKDVTPKTVSLSELVSDGSNDKL